jgi:hypothetical protein
MSGKSEERPEICATMTRKPYSSPRMTVYGTVQSLTLGAPGNKVDSGGVGTKK